MIQHIICICCNWQGKKNPGTDQNSVISFLKSVMDAKEMKIDRLFHSNDSREFVHVYYSGFAEIF